MKVWRNPLPLSALVASRMRGNDTDVQLDKSDLVPVLAVMTSALVVVGACLFLVWVRVAQVDAGYKIHDLRDEELRLRHDKSALTLERASLMRPERLARIAQTELNLVPPDPTRAVQVVATTSPTPAASLEVKP